MKASNRMVAPQIILVVDDDKMNREIEQFYLERNGYTVFPAASGAEALTLLEQHPIHLVLTDFNMPGMKGDELAKHIQMHHPMMPIILVSSDRHLVDYAHALNIQCIEKPIQLSKFLHVIESTLTAHYGI